MTAQRKRRPFKVEDYIERESHQLFYSFAFSFLLLRYNDTFIPEISYLVDDFEKFLLWLKVFGGRRYYVPTLKDFSEAMRTALAAHLFLVKKKTWSNIKAEFQLTQPELEKLKIEIKNYEAAMKSGGQVLSPLVRRR